MRVRTTHAPFATSRFRSLESSGIAEGHCRTTVLPLGTPDRCGDRPSLDRSAMWLAGAGRCRCSVGTPIVRMLPSVSGPYT